MTTKNLLSSFAACSVMLAGVAAPVTANAQGWAYHHREQTKNQWKNLGIAGAALGVLGLATHNGTLTTLGVAGGLYSAYRYEQDRKSQNKHDRARAQFYGRTSYNYKGHRYVRKTVVKNGQKYYQFVRG